MSIGNLMKDKRNIKGVIEDLTEAEAKDIIYGFVGIIASSSTLSVLMFSKVSAMLDSGVAKDHAVEPLKKALAFMGWGDENLLDLFEKEMK